MAKEPPQNKRPVVGTVLKPKCQPGETKEQAARRIAKRVAKLLRGTNDENREVTESPGLTPREHIATT